MDNIKRKQFAMFIIIVLILFQINDSHAFERYNHVVKYDQYFSKYSKRYFGPGFDWHLFKAQAIAEFESCQYPNSVQ